MSTTTTHRVTNRSVRDIPVRASIKAGLITVSITPEKFQFELDDWPTKGANPNFDQNEFLTRRTGHWDEQPGGPCQAQRIRDAARAAVNTLLKTQSQ